MKNILTIFILILITTISFTSEKSKHEKFLQKIKEFENSSDFSQKYQESKSKKYTNQISNLPPMAPTVWDTILFDTSEVLLTINQPAGALAFMHGRVAVDDSGNVHVVSLKEDEIMRYHRSTDYGETFQPSIVLADTIGGVREVKTSGTYVYIYSVNSTNHPSPQILLFTSPDRGVSWNPVKIIPLHIKQTFTTRNDTVFDFFETGAGGSIFQGESFDAGMTFSPYLSITDTIFSAIQTPNAETSSATSCYVRTGDKFNILGSYIYRSFNLGNSWQIPISLDQPNLTSQMPEISNSLQNFHISLGPGHLLYKKSENNGVTFGNELTLCHFDSSCSAEIIQQISATEQNIFTFWQDNLNYNGYKPILRFSRDNGDSWAKSRVVSEFEQGVTGIHNIISITSDDSLVYTSFVTVKPIPNPQFPTSVERKTIFRRGFYKTPIYFSQNQSYNFGIIDSTQGMDTTLTISNKGILPLQISQIELPYFYSTDSLNFPITIQTDSSFVVNLYGLNDPGIYSDSIIVYTNQPVDEIKTIPVSAIVIVTDLDENENVPERISLSQNYPNPFNPETVINYELGIKNYEKASLTIFNVLGKEVRKWILRESNNDKVIWNGTDNFGNPVSSGVYLYQLKVGKFNETKKMVLLR